MNKLSLVFWIAALSLLAACGSYSSPVSAVDRSPSYMTGLWVPTDYTLSFMDRSGYKFSQHSIELLDDGRIHFVNIPSRWIFRGQVTGMAFYSGWGTWSLGGPPTSVGDTIVTAHVRADDGEEADIPFSTVLEVMGFVPLQLPPDMHWVNFQKCFPYLHISDPKLKPMVDALNASKRLSLGFSPITNQDHIKLEDGWGAGDAGMSASNDFSDHYIQFKRTGDWYVWIYESEEFKGPEKWYDSDAAEWQETITLQYQVLEINGGPVKDLMVDYIGHDPRLQNNSQNWYLSNKVQTVKPVLDEWRAWRATQPPSSQALCP
jgi:hypothetical protein